MPILPSPPSSEPEKGIYTAASNLPLGFGSFLWPGWWWHKESSCPQVGTMMLRWHRFTWCDAQKDILSGYFNNTAHLAFTHELSEGPKGSSFWPSYPVPSWCPVTSFLLACTRRLLGGCAAFLPSARANAWMGLQSPWPRCAELDPVPFVEPWVPGAPCPCCSFLGALQPPHDVSIPSGSTGMIENGFPWWQAAHWKFLSMFFSPVCPT